LDAVLVDYDDAVTSTEMAPQLVSRNDAADPTAEN
jgi:hypothetical protein